jgi:hypothetical protein
VFANSYLIRFHDATVRYDVFPYPLEDVSGILDIQPGHWEFRDFQGRHNGGEFRTHGRSHAGEGVSVEIRGDNVALDEELEAALQPKLRAAYQAFAPVGRMSFAAQIDHLPDLPNEVDVTVTARGWKLRPSFFPYELNDVNGTVRYAQNQVNLDNLSSRHGDTVLSIGRGKVYLKPSGGFWAKLSDLGGTPIVPDDELIQALPPVLRKAATSLGIKDPLNLQTQLVIDMPSEPNLPAVLYWDGGIAVNNARLNLGVPVSNVTGQIYSRGRFNGRELEGVIGNILLQEANVFRQPFQNIHSQVEVTREAPQVVRLPNFKARLFGGDVGGEARIEFGPTLRYDVNLTALQVKLEELSQHNLGGNAEMSGLATARLFLSGRGTELSGLEGRGSFDVPRGQIYNLPVLLDLLKVLNLRPPDRTAFEEAHAAFQIRGKRMHIDRLDLFGNVISLSGQGEMNLDGTDLQLDFYAVWARIVQLLPPIIREIPPAISQHLLKIKVRGELGNVRCTREPVPVLVDPIERLLRRTTREKKTP